MKKEWGSKWSDWGEVEKNNLCVHRPRITVLFTKQWMNKTMESLYLISAALAIPDGII
jgi:hypothetical protein